MGISQRKDGTFDVYLRVGGKRLATTARTRQEAEAKLHQLQRELGLLDRSATLATAFSLLLARPLKPASAWSTRSSGTGSASPWPTSRSAPSPRPPSASFSSA